MLRLGVNSLATADTDNPVAETETNGKSVSAEAQAMHGENSYASEQHILNHEHYALNNQQYEHELQVADS